MTRFHIGNEKLPYAAGASYPHWVTATVPPIEIANHTDTFRIGRPYSKTNAGNSIDFMLVSAKEAICMTMPPLAEKVKIKIGQLLRIGVRIVSDMFVVAPIAPDQSVMLGQAIRLTPPFKKVTARNALQGDAALGDEYFGGIGHEGAHNGQTISMVSPQDGEWVMVSRFADPD
jgi:hypothetical protein